jgi:hypothetical protein
MATEAYVGEVGDDLVAVHVERGARAGLEDIDDEVAPVLRFLAQDRVACGNDGVRDLRFHRAQLAVGKSRRFLQENESADEERVLAEPADGIVFDRALCLRAVERISRDADFADGVAFDSSFHCSPCAQQCSCLEGIELPLRVFKDVLVQ